jgi:histidine phosphotransferase ChpT
LRNESFRERGAAPGQRGIQPRLGRPLDRGVHNGAPVPRLLIRELDPGGIPPELSPSSPTGSTVMAGQINLDALDLAALLCSRVCHDLISPTGAIVNGLEVLEEKESDEETKTFALDLIKKSAKTASARLQFCRLAFGAAGSSAAQIDLGDAEGMARGCLDEKTKVTWQLPRMLLPKNRVKLLLNMLIIAGQTIPRGGMLTVDPIGEGDSMGFRITAAGLNARIPQALTGLLEGRPESGTVDAHAIQPFYTGLLAKACGMEVSLAAEGDSIVVAAR